MVGEASTFHEDNGWVLMAEWTAEQTGVRRIGAEAYAACVQADTLLTVAKEAQHQADRIGKEAEKAADTSNWNWALRIVGDTSIDPITKALWVGELRYCAEPISPEMIEGVEEAIALAQKLEKQLAVGTPIMLIEDGCIRLAVTSKTGFIDDLRAVAITDKSRRIEGGSLFIPIAGMTDVWLSNDYGRASIKDIVGPDAERFRIYNPQYHFSDRLRTPSEHDLFIGREAIVEAVRAMPEGMETVGSIEKRLLARVVAQHAGLLEGVELEPLSPELRDYITDNLVTMFGAMLGSDKALDASELSHWPPHYLAALMKVASIDPNEIRAMVDSRSIADPVSAVDIGAQEMANRIFDKIMASFQPAQPVEADNTSPEILLAGEIGYKDFLTVAEGHGYNSRTALHAWRTMIEVMQRQVGNKNLVSGPTSKAPDLIQCPLPAPTIIRIQYQHELDIKQAKGMIKIDASAFPLITRYIEGFGADYPYVLRGIEATLYGQSTANYRTYMIWKHVADHCAPLEATVASEA